MKPKILFLDIETAPNTAYVWGLFDQNINIGNVIETSRVLCWAAKWRGSDTIMFQSEVGKKGKQHMLTEIHKLLDEADAVVHYNGTRFDIPNLNKEFIEAGMTPPSPFKEIDLLKTMRKKFKFTSNKLDFITKQLNLGSKTKHAGMSLWVDCMAGDKAAWKKMEEYNKNDVVLLESLYDRVLPWIKGTINYGIFDDHAVCPHCGSEDLQKRGFNYTPTAKYQRYSCNSCGAWSQEKKAEHSSWLKEA